MRRRHGYINKHTGFMIKKLPFLFLGVGIMIAIVSLIIFKGRWHIGADVRVETHSIVLGEEGFSPQEVIITKGDTVLFKTSRSVPFWPASNLHPTHDIYSEFDPQMPIDPDNEWRFTFKKIGKWQFHDHLAPKYTGTIIVQDAAIKPLWANMFGSTSDPACSTISGKQQKQCWQDLIVSTMKNEGLGKAFDHMTELHKSEPLFREACHDITHKLGTAAHTMFVSGTDFEVSSQSTICSFGFYHGFMETLVQFGSDITLAQAFCSYVDGKLAHETPNAVLSCYHGIGHGLTDLHDKSEWGDERAMIKPALATCKKIAASEKQLLLCGTGVFDSIALAYYNKAYGMEMKKDDPLWLCREQKDVFEKSCYMDMMPAILWLGGQNLAGSAPYVEKFVPDTYAATSIQSLSANSVRFTIQPDGTKPDVPTCRMLKKSLYLPCIEGLATGVMEFGTPGIEYKGALDFCFGPLLLEEERAPCIKSVLSYSSERYSQSKFDDICATVSVSYRHLCAQ